MYLSDSEEWLVILAASVIIIGLLVKTYRDYKSMTFDMNKKVAKQKEDEAYVRKLKKVVDEKNEQLKKVIEQKNRAKK
jgi:Na+-transporting methylmalonyl-CoA/oxaloacetate decarboxylase gamma subunit